MAGFRGGDVGGDGNDEIFGIEEAIEELFVVGAEAVQEKQRSPLARAAAGVGIVVFAAATAWAMEVGLLPSSAAPQPNPPPNPSVRVTSPSGVPTVPVTPSASPTQSETIDPCGCPPPQTQDASTPPPSGPPSATPSGTPSPSGTPTQSSNTPQPQLTANFKLLGLDLVVKGSGFPPGVQVDLLWDDYELNPVWVASDGSISEDVTTLPALAGGSMHTLKAEVGTTVVASVQVKVPGIL